MAGFGRRRGFTLVELLVVMGLFAALATISTGGYYAIKRGMEERGAVSASAKILRAAWQRACVDRVPTALYLYNEYSRTSADEDARAHGVAVAVQMAGRISRVDNDNLCDEFADLNKMYVVEDDTSSSGTMRLWRLPPKTKGDEKQLEYSVVGSSVKLVDANESVLVSRSGRDTLSGGGGAKIQMYAFVKKGGDATWRNGDAYALEFASLHLPDGYAFGYGSKPRQPGAGESLSRDDAGVYFFDPDLKEYPTEAANKIVIYAQRPGKDGSPEMTKIGTAADDEKHKND